MRLAPPQTPHRPPPPAASPASRSACCTEGLPAAAPGGLEGRIELVGLGEVPGRFLLARAVRPLRLGDLVDGIAQIEVGGGAVGAGVDGLLEVIAGGGEPLPLEGGLAGL